MKALFSAILYQPMFNILVGLYNFIPDIGVAIIILTVIIRLILYWPSKSAIRAQKQMQSLQPRLAALKQEFKDDKQKLAQATMQLYKENKVSPMSSCLPILIQLPILLALYWVLRDGLNGGATFANLYSFIVNPGSINPVSFGFVNLAKANIALAVLAGAAQFLQTKMLYRKQPPLVAGAGGKDESMMAMMNKQMLYFMPLMTVFIGFSIPGGLTLYWLVTTVFTIGQQWWLFRDSAH